MNDAAGKPGNRITGDLARSFREQALQIINASLEEAQTQHPLDVPRVFEYDRPSLGGSVPIPLYRVVRLLALREVVGSKISAAILNVCGRSVARKMRIRNVQELVCALENLSVGKLTSLKQTDDSVVLAATECATCSGLPNIGEAVCHFETGFIAGGLENVLGKSVGAVETQCWGLGDTICRWEAERDLEVPQTGTNGLVDPLQILMSLAGKAAAAVDSAVAIRQKNRQLREAYHKLEESERLKKDLTDMIVHDMREPLNAVMGSIETLAEMTGSRLVPQESEVLNMAVSSGQSLLQMINDLLDISKLEERSLALRKSPTEIAELIERAANQVRILARRRGQKLDVQIAPDIPEVPVDRDRMMRVLVNLLGNAVRHTPRGGRISVGGDWDAAAKMIRITVSDTGEGIPKEYHAKIFDKFVQVESQQTRKRFSTGLGLTFCKLMTEAHGGSICVESEPGAGSTFTFTIPVSD